LRWDPGREALLWSLAAAMGLVALFLAWSRPIDRSAATQGSPFTELSVVRYKGDAEAPDFSLPTLEGGAVTVSTLRGQVVFLNFWATWCPPCREEMPSIERLHREFRDQGLAILAVDVDERPTLVAEFMKDFRLSFPILLDRGSEVSSRYGVGGLPTTILVDRRGRIVGGAIGPRDWASPAGRALIRSLLEQPMIDGR
jgi:peroxiredoxin